MSTTPSLRVLTPPGRGGVTSLRLEGIEQLRTPLRSAVGAVVAWPPPGRVRYVSWQAGSDAALIDECVVVGCADAVEIHLHGGEGVLSRLASSLGLEVLRRGDWVPRGPRALRAAASARWGWMAETCVRLHRGLALGQVSADTRDRASQALEHEVLGRRLARAPRVRLIGRPNAGKSTLFNALLAESRALVSAHPGTTRDAVEARWMLAEVEVLLEDTAGRFDAASTTGVDLLLRVRRPGGEAVALPAEELPSLQVCTHGDQAGAVARSGEILVSGRDGSGLSQVLEALTTGLQLTGGAAVDVRAPLDGATRRLLRAGLAAAGPPEAGAD